eukprot:gene17207-20469_t
MATYEPKNILLTGGAGFICSHVVYRLVTKYPEYKIVVLDKLDYCASLKNLKSVKDRPNFKFVKGDIGSADLVSYVLASDQIDTIMHFAAQTHVDNSFGNSFTFTENNILGTHVLLESAKNYGGIKRFIHVSTDEVYGETSVGSETGNFENNALEPTNPYSATKAGAEMLVKAYQTSYGLPCIVTRGNNVYGPHQFPEKLIPKFVLLALRGQKLPIHGDGSNTRSYMFVEDVAAAFEAVLLKGEVGTVYNIGTQKERTVKDVAESICTYFKLDQEKVIQYVENRPFNDLRYYLDNSKLRGLGWEETTEWADGIKKTIEWFKLHGESGWWETDIGSALIAHPRAGIFNFTNPGAISHNEVLQLYKEYVDPNYTWDNFTLEEQAKVITAPRSNNELDVTKMLNEFPQIKDIRESFIEFVFKPYVAGGGKPIARVETSAVAPPSPSTPLNLAPEKPVPASCAVGAKPKFLIFGRNGWIGGLLGEILKGQGEEYQYADCRLQERSKLEALIDQYKPTHVLNAAGVTGRPNVDWCESHKQETIRTNVVGVLTLCDVCTARGIHMTNFATGCIFEYDKDHPEASGIGFKEGDKPNFVGSFYSFTKALVESIMLYEHVLTLRVRMPITHDLTNTRNFITKIVNYDKVVDIPNSMTVLDELLPYSVEMAKRRLTGIYNFTNPGVISHNQVLQLYKEHVDPSYTWSNFTLEEQSKVIVAPRSNNELDVTKLKEQFPEMKSISESLVDFVYKPYIAGGGKPVCTTR